MGPRLNGPVRTHSLRSPQWLRSSCEAFLCGLRALSCPHRRLLFRASPQHDAVVRVLVVEDDRSIAELHRRAACARRASRSTSPTTASTASSWPQAEPYDAAVVDVMLPRLDGLSLVTALRRRRRRTPVLILSARHTVDDRVKGLQTGGDDYLTKPFAFAELLARVQALIRRGHRRRRADDARASATCALDLLTRKVERGGTPIELRPREFALLEYLMRNAGRVVSKTMILSHVWDYSFDPGTNVVDVLVYRLRDKIDKGFEPKLLQTVRGVGYVLKVE